jgi:hypothetical protein
MAIHWRLKTYLATRHGIYGALALQKLIVKKTGVLISIQNLCNYLDKKPKVLPLKTMEILVTALECKLTDFCRITPAEFQSSSTPQKLSYQNTPLAKRAVKSFPDPQDYTE